MASSTSPIHQVTHSCIFHGTGSIPLKHGHNALNVSIEAQTSFGWERFIGRNGIAVSVDSFGLSAPYADLKKHYGFEESNIVDQVKQKLSVLSVAQ